MGTQDSTLYFPSSCRPTSQGGSPLSSRSTTGPPGSSVVLGPGLRLLRHCWGTPGSSDLKDFQPRPFQLVGFPGSRHEDMLALLPGPEQMGRGCEVPGAVKSRFRCEFEWPVYRGRFAAPSSRLQPSVAQAVAGPSSLMVLCVRLATVSLRALPPVARLGGRWPGSFPAAILVSWLDPPSG